MTIKNIGSKIISIGSTVLMPDAEMKATKAITATPAIDAMVEMGLLSITEDAKQKTAPNDDSAKKASEEATKKAAEESAKKSEEDAAKKTAENAKQ